MSVIRCENGHFYDDAKYGGCPHCASGAQGKARAMNDDVTVAQGSDAAIAEAALRSGGVQKQLVEFAMAGGDDRTVAYYQAEKGIDPVVGWLVCTAGKELGRDYRLHAGRNFVGRALKSDIALPDDERISRENHCTVVFDPKTARFYAVNGRGDGLSVNGARVQESVALSDGDAIEIGDSAFVFIPYCKEGRTW